MVAVGIITEMLIAPTLPPFDDAVAVLVPVAAMLTAPAEVTEPALVISAVTSAALVTWASGRRSGAVNQPAESARAFAVAVLVPVAGDGHRAGGDDRASDRGEHRRPGPVAVGRNTPMPSPNDAGTGVGLCLGDVRPGSGHDDGRR
jgi:hypothetical protein